MNRFEGPATFLCICACALLVLLAIVHVAPAVVGWVRGVFA